MGWEGEAIFEEEINNEWVKFGEIDRRMIMPYKEICFPSFVKVTPDDPMSDHYIGVFYWHNYVKAPYVKITNSSFLEHDEILENLAGTELAKK